MKEWKVKSKQKRYYERKANGLCVKCGEPFTPNNDAVYCPQCNLFIHYSTRRHYANNKEYYRKRDKKAQAKRRKNNLCLQCGGEKTADSEKGARCPTC